MISFFSRLLLTVIIAQSAGFATPLESAQQSFVDECIASSYESPDDSNVFQILNDIASREVVLELRALKKQMQDYVDGEIANLARYLRFSESVAAVEMERYGEVSPGVLHDIAETREKIRKLNQLRDEKMVEMKQKIDALRVLSAENCWKTFRTIYERSELSLAGHGLSEIDVIVYFPRLKTLDLSNNKLSSLGFLNSLMLIEKLDVSHNEIEQVGANQESLTLKYLNIDDNKLGLGPQEERLSLDGFPALTTLLAQHNWLGWDQLDGFPPVGASALKYLDLRDNVGISHDSLEEYMRREHLAYPMRASSDESGVGTSNYSDSLDSDGDGIADSKDQCDRTPERLRHSVVRAPGKFYGCALNGDVVTH